MSLRMNERFPIHNACRWEQLWRQREFASPVREGINQIRACRVSRNIPEPTSQETRVPPPDSTPAEETAALQEFPGIWQGQSLVNIRGLCGLRFEKPNPQKPREFLGYTTSLLCLHAPDTKSAQAGYSNGRGRLLGARIFHPDGNCHERRTPVPCRQDAGRQVSAHLIHHDTVLDATRRQVAGRFLRRRSNASEEG